MEPTFIPPDLSQRAYMPQQSKKRNPITVIGMILLVLIAVGAVGYSVYAYLKNDELASKLSRKDSELSSLLSEKRELEQKLKTAEKTSAMITQKLPNGYTATFPDTEGNRSILFWTANASTPNDIYVALSHTAIQAFLSGVPQEKRTPLCGTEKEPKAIINAISTGIFNIDTKELIPPRTGDCVAMLASEQNTDTALRKKASETIQLVNKDTQAFIKEAAFKKN